nr:hypothetical protein [Tanacetum cinerariifolium]
MDTTIAQQKALDDELVTPANRLKIGNVYGALLPQHLTNQDMLESKAYKTYHAYATGNKKLPAQGLETLTEITLSEAKQIKIGTKRSKIQFHSSHTSGLDVDEGTGVSAGVPDVPICDSDNEPISWKSSDDKDDDADDQSDDDEDD